LTERLRADCEHCFGLCCVVPALTASADFAIDKDAGQPCPNLQADFRCSIHDHLRERGFPGCTTYDCFGAGQQVAQVTFGGRDWRRTPGIAKDMFASFTVMRQLHELLWYLTEARALRAAEPLHDELDEALDNVDRLTRSDADALIGLDVGALREEVSHLLRRASELARGHARLDAELSGADLIGKDLGRADLRAASLRNAYLIGANLRDADLRTADVLGADFRGADLSGADLSTSIFLIQAQVDAARGDSATRLPPALSRPGHWPGVPAGPGGS
jgi:uncharacterized protein YjbI with pentapeptide repeats